MFNYTGKFPLHKISHINSDLSNTSIIYTLLVDHAWYYINMQNYITINGDMGVPFQARSRYFSRLAVLKLS